MELEFDSRKYGSSGLGGWNSSASTAADAANGEEGNGAGEGKEGPTAYIVYLRSYAGGMGTADVSCASGCTCQRTRIDGTWQELASLQEMHRFKVGWLGWRPVCLQWCV